MHATYYWDLKAKEELTKYNTNTEQMKDTVPVL